MSVTQNSPTNKLKFKDINASPVCFEACSATFALMVLSGEFIAAYERFF